MCDEALTSTKFFKFLADAGVIPSDRPEDVQRVVIDAQRGKLIEVYYHGKTGEHLLDAGLIGGLRVSRRIEVHGEPSDEKRDELPEPMRWHR